MMREEVAAMNEEAGLPKRQIHSVEQQERQEVESAVKRSMVQIRDRVASRRAAELAKMTDNA